MPIFFNTVSKKWYVFNVFFSETFSEDFLLLKILTIHVVLLYLKTPKHVKHWLSTVILNKLFDEKPLKVQNRENFVSSFPVWAQARSKFGIRLSLVVVLKLPQIFRESEILRSYCSYLFFKQDFFKNSNIVAPRVYFFRSIYTSGSL